MHDLEAVDRWCRQRRVDAHPLRQLRNDYYKKFRSLDVAAMRLPDGLREGFLADVGPGPLEFVRRHDSNLDGATKLIFKTSRGLLVESVILRVATGRTTVCISSQVGCAANCRFCATGKMGIAQDLTAGEIVDQVLQAGQVLAAENRSIRNIVFMGMGEPFHNTERVFHALDILQAAQCFNFAPQRILVSTVGIPGEIVRYAERFPKMPLAVSLHSARQDVREQIIPVARRHQLAELQQALRLFVEQTKGGIMVEYLMLRGVNDTSDDVGALVEFLREIPSHINLIPFNAVAEVSDLEGTDRAEIESFACELKRAGFKVTVRYSLGADIAAACGQLVRKENRQIALATQRG